MLMHGSISALSLENIAFRIRGEGHWKKRTTGPRGREEPGARG